MTALLYLWQVPQNLAGLVLWAFRHRDYSFRFKRMRVGVDDRFVSNRPGDRTCNGVSLGRQARGRKTKMPMKEEHEIEAANTVIVAVLGLTCSLLLLFFCTGCCRKLLPAASTDVYDSVRIERVEVIRMDTVKVPVPVERVEVTVPADTTSMLTTSLARSTAALRGGLLYHTLENRQDGPIKAVVPVKDTETTTEQVRSEVIREPYPVETPLTWWQRFRMDVGGWAMAALTGIVGWWAVRRFVSRK